MFENLGQFAIAYACVSITVTLVMLAVANRSLKLGGAFGMVRASFLLVLAVVGFITWVLKKVTGDSPPGETAHDQIRRTIRKTSSWLDSLQKEWDGAKGERNDTHQLPGPRDRNQR